MITTSEFTKIKFLFALIIGAGLISTFANQETKLAAKSLSPIYALSSNASEVPLLSESLRDPDLLQQRPASDYDASRLLVEIREYQTDLKSTKGWRKADLHDQAYKAYVKLSYYLEDVISGRITNDIKVSKARSDLLSVRRALISHASQSAKLSKEKSVKSQALYHIYVTNYLTGKGKGNAVKSLLRLQKNNLNSFLVRRAKFLEAVHTVEYSSNSKKKAAARSITSMIGSLPADAGVSGRLVAARYYAGLNRHGHKSSKANKAYRGYLYGASKRVASLSTQEKEQVLSFSTAVWTKAEGRSVNWSKAPMRLASFGENDTVRAIVERSALHEWYAGKKSRAFTKYKTLSKSFAVGVKKAAIDLRILDLYKASSAKNGASYEKALLAAQKDYLDPGLLGEGNETKVTAMQNEIRNRYKSLAFAELDRAANTRAVKSQRTRAIRMGKSYMATLDDNAKIEQVKAKIANIYHLDKQYAQAVSLYRELGETNVSNKTAHYYKLAIAAQSQLAHWSTKVMWSKQKNQYANHREDLVSLYRLLGDSNKAQSWYVWSQIGLLNLSLGKADEAFKIWEDGLKKSTQGAYPAHAAGYMLTAYSGSKNWNKLETLARLTRTAKMNPVYKNKSVNTYNLLALALLEGGKEAMDSNQYAVAVKKLEEFVNKFTKASRRDEGTFSLASAYRGNSQHKNAIDTLVAFTKDYRKSSYYKQALLNGGDWSVEMAFEDSAIYFYQKFHRDYKKDGDAHRIRNELIALYQGREIYGQANDLLVEIGSDKALMAAMDNEIANGSESDAIAIANTVLKKRNATEAAKAEALGAKGRFAARSNKYQELVSIEKQLNSLSGGTYESQESLGEIRYLIAESKSKGILSEYYNLTLTNPEAELNKRYAKYLKVRDSYHLVCEAGQSSFCAPAMNNLARLSEKFLQHLEDINIQETLAKNVVDKFNGRKQAIFNEATRTSQRSDAKAVEVVVQGNTNPNWTQAVLWQNSSDWNFERVSGETGNGYVQWSANNEQAE